MTPKVSVCIPTHNTERYLPQAIESVLEQEFADYELVICDNASTDGTPELCLGYKDSRIRYVRFNEKTDQAGNFNRCLDQVNGEYFTLLHADDLFLPRFLADRVRRLHSHPDAGFVFGAVKIIDANGQVTETKGRWAGDRIFDVGEALESLLFGCIVSPPSLMVRSSCVDKAGKFQTNLTWGHDWEWVLRLASCFGAIYGSEPLAAYRVHDDSGTAEVLSTAKNGHQERKILEDTFARLALTDSKWQHLRPAAFKALSRRHMYFAECGLLDGQKRVARNNLYYAARADSLMLTRPTFWALLLGSLGPAGLYRWYRGLRNETLSAQS
jgi:glycosyltransferase involved in cell wall biosynthesis